MMASGALAIDTILPAFADVRAEFGMPAGSSRVGWLVTAFFLGLAIGPWLYGPASDRFGRRRPLQAGMVLYIGAGAPRSRRRGRSSWPRGSCGASGPAHRAR